MPLQEFLLLNQAVGKKCSKTNLKQGDPFLCQPSQRGSPMAEDGETYPQSALADRAQFCVPDLLRRQVL